MDMLDKDLLAALAADSSTPVSELARRLGVARSTVQARITRLEQSGLIAGYTIRLGEPLERRRIHAYVLVEAEPRSTAAILSRLKPMPEVELCHTTTGRADIVLSVVAETTADLERCLDRVGALPGIRATESLIVLGTKLDRRV